MRVLFKALSRVTLAASLVLAILPAQAQDAAERLSGLLSKADTISGRFSQMTLDATGMHLQEAQGNMLLQRPGKFRWHTDPPLEQELVSDGTTVWLYDPDLMQVTIQKMDQRLSHTPALLLSGSAQQIKENFDVTVEEGGTMLDFFLKPKAKDTLFDTLRLSFRNGVINDMQLVDAVGQRTNILFLEVNMNKPVDSKQFTFVTPAGVDEIKE